MPFPYTGRDSPLPKIDLSDEHLKAIARIALEWSRLEAMLESLLWELMQLGAGVGGLTREHIVGRAVTTHLNFDMRVNAIRAFTIEIAGLDGPPTKTFNEMAARMDALRVQRNLIVHGEWIWGHGEPYFVDRKARGKGITSEPKTYDPAAMEALRSDIEKASSRLRAFSWDIQEPTRQFYRRTGRT